MAKKTAAKRGTSAGKKWSAAVTENSDALDLKPDLFELADAKKIAASLKRSAEESDRKKSAPFRSAMSMLTFYINRAGKKLDPKQKTVLENTKDELRIAFGRTPGLQKTSRKKS